MSEKSGYIPLLGDLSWKCIISVKCPKCQGDADIGNDLETGKAQIACEACGEWLQIDATADEIERSILETILNG